MIPDQLNQYLLSTYSSYFSGSNGSDILLWSSAKYNSIPQICSLNVGMDFDLEAIAANGEDIEKYIRKKLNQKYCDDKMFKRTLNWGKMIAQVGNTRFVTIVYPSFDKYKLKEWHGLEKKYPFSEVKFFYKDFTCGGKSGLVSGESLRKEIHHLLSISNQRIGTNKEENRQIADYFHYWSRNYLSPEIVKNDVDGGFFDSQTSESVLIEIKRSNKPQLEKWWPYKEDRANYYMEFQFCSKNNLHYWILHHTGKNKIDSNSRISFFDVNNVDPQCATSHFITVNNSYCKDQIEIMPLSGRNSLENELEKLGLNSKYEE